MYSFLSCDKLQWLGRPILCVYYNIQFWANVKYHIHDFLEQTRLINVIQCRSKSDIYRCPQKTYILIHTYTQIYIYIFRCPNNTLSSCMMWFANKIIWIKMFYPSIKRCYLQQMVKSMSQARWSMSNHVKKKHPLRLLYI